MYKFNCLFTLTARFSLEEKTKKEILKIFYIMPTNM